MRSFCATLLFGAVTAAVTKSEVQTNENWMSFENPEDPRVDYTWWHTVDSTKPNEIQFFETWTVHNIGGPSGSAPGEIQWWWCDRNSTKNGNILCNLYLYYSDTPSVGWYALFVEPDQVDQVTGSASPYNKLYMQASYEDREEYSEVVFKGSNRD